MYAALARCSAAATVCQAGCHSAATAAATAAASSAAAAATSAVAAWRSNFAFGGAVSVGHGVSRLVAVQVSGCVASSLQEAAGGGVIVRYGRLEMVGGRVAHCNVSTVDGPACGGGIAARGGGEAVISSVEVAGCTSYSAASQAFGGGVTIMSYSSVLTMTDCTVSGCAAISSDGVAWGGGIQLNGGHALLRDVHVLRCNVRSHYRQPYGGTAHARIQPAAREARAAKGGACGLRCCTRGEGCCRLYCPRA
jgi:hypothetical protein